MSSKKFYIYVYLNPLKKGDFNYNDIHFDYEPFYIGKGYGTRIKKHLCECNINNCKNKLKVNTIRKIQSKKLSPIMIKLFENLTEKQSFKKERELIKLIGRRDLKKGCLVNMTDGGDGYTGVHFGRLGKPLSEETKKKISETIKRQGKWAGNNNPSKTKEHREMMSKLLSGRIISEETKEKLRKKALLRTHTEETKKKIGDWMRGKTFKGRFGEIKAKEIGNKISIKLKGRKNNIEHITRMSIAQILNLYPNNYIDYISELLLITEGKLNTSKYIATGKITKIRNKKHWICNTNVNLINKILKEFNKENLK